MPSIRRLNLDSLRDLVVHGFYTPFVRCVQLNRIHKTNFPSGSKYKDLISWLSQVHTLHLAYCHYPLSIVQNELLCTLFSQIAYLVLDMIELQDNIPRLEVHSQLLLQPVFPKLKEIRLLVRKREDFRLLKRWYHDFQAFCDIVPTIERLKVYAPFEVLQEAKHLASKPLPHGVTLEMTEVVISDTRSGRESLEKIIIGEAH